eukprot:15485376-Alexandrium_andersonii.AAC.1
MAAAAAIHFLGTNGSVTVDAAAAADCCCRCCCCRVTRSQRQPWNILGELLSYFFRRLPDWIIYWII